MDGLQTWVINLDRAPGRLARIRAQLQALGLPYTRLPAVNARALKPEQSAALDEAAYRRKHGMSPVPGELGCYLSHVEAMRRFLVSDAACALILEDAKAYAQGLLPMSLPCDHVFDQRWRFGLKVRLVTPRPVGTTARPPAPSWRRPVPAAGSGGR
jgi:hypothetical protein